VVGRSPQTYLSVAEAARRWVLDQVRWDDGPWIPVSVTASGATGPSWTAEEQRLADAVAERVRAAVAGGTDPATSTAWSARSGC
jgi:hypothetical protein